MPGARFALKVGGYPCMGFNLSSAFFSASLFLSLRTFRGSRSPRDTSRVTALYSVDLISVRNHDAVIPIGSLAPKWWVHSVSRHGSNGGAWIATTPDLFGRIRGQPGPTDEFWSSRFAIGLRVPTGS